MGFGKLMEAARTSHKAVRSLGPPASTKRWCCAPKEQVLTLEPYRSCRHPPAPAPCACTAPGLHPCPCPPPWPPQAPPPAHATGTQHGSLRAVTHMFMHTPRQARELGENIAQGHIVQAAACHQGATIPAAATHLRLLGCLVLLPRLLDALERRLYGLPEQVRLHLQAEDRWAGSSGTSPSQMAAFTSGHAGAKGSCATHVCGPALRLRAAAPSCLQVVGRHLASGRLGLGGSLGTAEGRAAAAALVSAA